MTIHRYMKVGLIHFMAYPATMKGEGPILETLRTIALDPFFDAVEITWIKDPVLRARARGILATSHMDVRFGASRSCCPRG